MNEENIVVDLSDPENVLENGDTSVASENEENSVDNLSDPEAVLESGDTSVAGESVTETVVAEVVEMEHPFLTTNFEDYSVSEGLLLVIVLILVVKFCIDVLRRGFYWL